MALHKVTLLQTNEMYITGSCCTNPTNQKCHTFLLAFVI